MLLTKWEKKAVPNRKHGNRNRITEAIEEFMESGWECAKIDAESYANYRSCQSTWSSRVSTMNLSHVLSVITDGEGGVYLVRKDD